VLREGLPAVIEESLEGDATPPDRYASTLLGLVIQHAWKDQLVEAVVFAIAFSNLAANLNSPVRVLGYAVGVAGGTFVGLAVDEWSSRDAARRRAEADEGEGADVLRPSPRPLNPTAFDGTGRSTGSLIGSGANGST
jgi:hypothetical protein